MKHLGGPERRAGVADERMRHGAEALLAAEEMRGGVRGVADETDRADLALGPRRADRGGVGHHFGHLLAGAVARIHGEERRLGHVGAHRPGVVGSDAGRSQLLQEDRLEIDQMEERARDVHHRLAGADPLALVVAQVDLDLGVARLARLRQPVERQPRRENHGTAHEDGVDHAAVTEPADHPLGAVEVVIGVAFDLAVGGMCHRPPRVRLVSPMMPAIVRLPAAPFARTGVPTSAARRAGTRVPAPGWR